MRNETNTNSQKVLVDTALACGMIEGMNNTKRTRRANRTGCLIDKGPGRPYLAKYTNVDGKVCYKSTGETNRNRALAKLDELTRASREDTVEDMITMLEAQLAILRSKKLKPELAISEIWNTYEPTLWEKKLTDGTKRGYASALTGLSAWMARNGCRNVSDVDHERAERYLRELEASIGAVSFNNRLVLIKGTWRALAATGKWNLVADVWEPFAKIKGVKHASKRRDLTDAEVRTILAHADDDLRQLCVIMLYTGLRLGDACQLKQADVDMDKGVISTIPIKTRRHGTRVTIPIHPALRAELERMDDGEYVNARNAHAYQTGNMQDRMSALFEKSGIETSIVENGKRKTITGAHAFRHTFISRAINSGMDPLLVQQIVGHSSIDMTAHYTHIKTETIRKGIEGLGNVAA